MTVLVLSATGNTGRATVRALVSRGAAVRAATRSPASADLPEEVEVVQFDILDRSTWNAALSGVDAVYFCLSATLSEELEVPVAFIKETAAQGVKRIITLSAFRAEVLTYAPHKQLEAAVEAAGVRWIHLRPNFFADNFFGLLSPQHTIDLPAGAGRTSFISVSDVGAAAAEALLGEHHGEIWTLTGPEAIDHEQVASILGEVLGRDIQFNDIPRGTFAQMLQQYMGVPAQHAERLATVYGVDVRDNKYAPVFDDFAQVLGRPAMTFRQWAEANAGAFAA